MFRFTKNKLSLVLCLLILIIQFKWVEYVMAECSTSDTVYNAWLIRQPANSVDQAREADIKAKIASAVLALTDPVMASRSLGVPPGPALDQAVEFLLSIRSSVGLAMGLRSANIGSQAAASAALVKLSTDADLTEARQIMLIGIEYLEGIKLIERGGEEIVIQRRSIALIREALSTVLDRFRNDIHDTDLLKRVEKQVSIGKHETGQNKERKGGG